jgi:hypothetical protein
MVLHRANFEIPARFTFRPFSARWRVCFAELVEWSKQPQRRPLGVLDSPNLREVAPGLEKVLVQIEMPNHASFALGLDLHVYGLGLNPIHTVEVSRADIPGDVLRAHENRQNTPNISGRQFAVLVCKRPEFEALFPSVKPGDVEKNAWVMLQEFLDLEDDEWEWKLWRFLNRWGLWSHEYGYSVGIRHPLPGFCLVFPHLIREKRDQFRKGLRSTNSRQWLNAAQPLSFSTLDKPPYFFVERCYCEDAIRAVITIEHLAGRRWGFCKRCQKLFECETAHERNYCSRRCIQAAGVQRWRDRNRKAKIEQEATQVHATRQKKRS